MSAATIDTAVWLALKSGVNSIQFGRPVPVAWPASTFEPGVADFIAVTISADPPKRMTIKAGKSRREGALTVVYVGAIGNDFAFYQQQAGIIADHFKMDTMLRAFGACVRVTKSPQVVAGYRDGMWYRIPVIVRWETFA